MHTLYDFLAEVRGNDRGTSVGVAAGYRGYPRVSTASATAHSTSTENAAVVAKARAEVPSVAHSVVLPMATHGSQWQLAASPDVQPQQFPRPSAAIATAILR